MSDTPHLHLQIAREALTDASLSLDQVVSGITTAIDMVMLLVHGPGTATIRNHLNFVRDIAATAARDAERAAVIPTALRPND